LKNFVDKGSIKEYTLKRKTYDLESERIMNKKEKVILGGAVALGLLFASGAVLSQQQAQTTETTTEETTIDAERMAKYEQAAKEIKDNKPKTIVGEVFENLYLLLTSLSCGLEKLTISIELFKSLLPTKIPPASGSKPSCLNSSNEFKISDGITI